MMADIISTDISSQTLPNMTTEGLDKDIQSPTDIPPQHRILQKQQTQEAVAALKSSIFDDDLFAENLFELIEKPEFNLEELLSQLGDPANELPQDIHLVGECQIHFEDVVLAPTICCQFPVCGACIATYVQLQVSEHTLRIACPNPNCKSFLSREEIRQKLDNPLKLKYDQFLVVENQDAHRKTCPRCNQITTDELYMNSAEPREMRRVKKYGLQITCSSCQLDWCFNCQAPYHQDITCSQYRQGNKLVKKWARRHNEGQVNAQKCPTCKIFIERNGGCDHMECLQCNTKFCYFCGGRQKVPLVLWPLLGDHESRLGVMGCCGNYMPDKPVQRRLARGAVLGAKIVAAPVILSVAVAAVPLAFGLVAAAIPIALVAVPIGYVFFKIQRAVRTISRKRRMYAEESLRNKQYVNYSSEDQVNSPPDQINSHPDKVNPPRDQVNPTPHHSLLSGRQNVTPHSGLIGIYLPIKNDVRSNEFDYMNDFLESSDDELSDEAESNGIDEIIFEITKL